MTDFFAKGARPIWATLALLIPSTLALAQASSTAPMPLYRRTAGWLAADTGTSKIFLCRDLDGDGRFVTAGEVTIFLDNSNASGLTAATNSLLTMYQAADGTVYYGSNVTATRTIYAARDNTLNGDAQQAGEVRPYADQTGPTPFTTPNGITGDASYIYLSISGTSPAPQDGVVRFHDTTGNHNANDAGESVLFADFNTIFGSAASSPFDLCSIGSTLYIADPHAISPAGGNIYKMVDGDASDSISSGEISIYHSANTALGPPTNFLQSCVSDGTYIYVHDRTGSVSPQTVARLHDDAPASGNINAAAEITTIWSETNLPAGATMGTSMSFALAPKALAIASTSPNALILARDMNGNGLFSDAADSTTTTSGVSVPASPSPVTFPGSLRFLLAYGWPCPADFSMSNGVNVADIFQFLSAWFAMDPRADFNGENGINVTDIFDYLVAWFGGC